MEERDERGCRSCNLETNDAYAGNSVRGISLSILRVYVVTNATSREAYIRVEIHNILIQAIEIYRY